VSCCLLQRYNFDKHALLLTLVTMTGQLAQHAAFTQVGECAEHQCDAAMLAREVAWLGSG